MMHQQRMRNYWNSGQVQIKKSHFKKWITQSFGLLEFLEFRNLAKKAIAVLVQMPKTHLCEEGFSGLDEIKSKKKLNT